MVASSRDVNTSLINGASECERSVPESQPRLYDVVVLWCRMGFLLKPLALLSVATHYISGLRCGPQGIPYVVDTHQAAPSVSCARRYHERAKYFSESHALGPPRHLPVHGASLLQTESGGDAEHKDEKNRHKEQHAGKDEEQHAGKHEEQRAEKHEGHAEKHEAQHAAKFESTPSVEGSERSSPQSAATFFPHLFHKAFKLTKKATRELNKCLEVMDDIKGNIDSLPHDATKMQMLSEHVKIDVGKDTKSVHQIVSDMRNAVDAIYHMQSYLSSAKSQINSQLRKVLPPSEES